MTEMGDTNTVPWLRSGVGETPADGGCVMQIIDWIDRNEWTDKPPCVDPAIQVLAVHTNDSIDDKGRQGLLDLVPRMMGTARDEELSVRLAIFCAARVLPTFEWMYPLDDRPRKAIEAAEHHRRTMSDSSRLRVLQAIQPSLLAVRAGGLPNLATHAAHAAYAAAEAAWSLNRVTDSIATRAYVRVAARAAADSTLSSALSSLLIATLDEHERLTGHHAVCSVDFSPVARVMAGVE